MSDEAVRQAMSAWREGKREEARRIIQKAFSEDPMNEKVLLAYAGMAPTKDIAIDMLKRVLAINPENEQAKKKLAELEPVGDEPIELEGEMVEERKGEILNTESHENQSFLMLVEQQKALLAEQKLGNDALISRLNSIHEEQKIQGKKISSINTSVGIVGVIILISFCGGLFFAFVGF